MTPTPEVVTESPDRTQVGDDAGLVVGCAAGEETAVALGGLEGRGVPLGVVVLRLDVVVGVEQDGRLAVGRGLPGEHRRRPAVVPGTHDAHVLEALTAEQVGHRFSAALHLSGARGIGADRLDADQVLQVRADAGQLRGHPRPQIVDVHGSNLRVLSHGLSGR